MLSDPSDPSEPWVPLVTSADERRIAEFALVLTARGFEHRRSPGVASWELWVPQRDHARAAAELVEYRSENSRPIGHRRVDEVGGGWPGAIAYIVVLLAVFFCVNEGVFALDWFGAGRLQSDRVLAGEWWRTVTALTVHLEFAHLAGNVVFGTFFGYFAGRYLGRGVGWLAIVGAGALANLLNALVQSGAHRSIGASTAVFAALGLLTAYTWRRGFFRETPWRGRIAPIVAGLGLLAFTGTSGENTDVFAHLAGFVCGFGGGLALARWATIELLRNRRLQRACAAAAIVIVVGAWVWGLAAAG